MTVAKKLEFYRRFPKIHGPLDWDPWITTHSTLSPKKLHAIGYVTFIWNSCEHHLFSIFAQVSSLSEATAWVMVHDLGDIAISTRIRVLASRRFAGDSETLAIIENALSVYEICRRNRNQLSHFTVAGGLSDDVLGLYRTSKKPNTRDSSPFADSLLDIRQVGRQCYKLSNRLQLIWMMLAISTKGRTEPWPNKLPLPKPLWTDQPPSPTTPSPRRRSSRK